MSAGGLLSRNTRKQERRAALMRGARAVLAEHGLEGFTTGRIATAAGIAQSGFYVYFDDRDACLQAVAGEVGLEVLLIIREARLQTTDAGMVEAFARPLRALVGPHRATAELFLRFRREPGPLGDVFRALLERAYTELHTDMIGLAQIADDPAGERLARYTLAAVIGVVEGLIDGHLDDVERVAEDLARIGAGVLAMEGT